MSIHNQLGLQTLGSQPVMPKNPPEHCARALARKEYFKLTRA